MKTFKPISLALIILSGIQLTSSGEEFRTDINPALLFYQAFLLAPDLSAPDSDYLFTNNWQGQKLPQRFGSLVAGYDNEFNLALQAARSKVPCDWGIDMSTGLQTRLPQLARAKAVALAARLRVPWHLQNGHPDEARDDLLASFALARNLPRDGTIISTLVQIAMEAIGSSSIAANFGQFPPATLQQLQKGLDALPARTTVVESIKSEKVLFLDWTRRKVEDLRREYPGNDAKVMEGIHDLMGLKDQVEGQSEFWQQLMQASGRTSGGILKLLNDREQLYDSITNFLELPYAEFEAQEQQFKESVENSPNPFIKDPVPSFIKAREKEFRILATLAIVRAAIEYKLHGEAGLQSVEDPCGTGSFAVNRFTFEGVDRGFELKSAFNLGHNQAVLIFVEKEGPPFQVDGNYPGRPLPVDAPKQ